MEIHSKIAIAITFLGLIAIAIWKIVEPKIADSNLALSSDRGQKGTIRIAIDSWVGYYPLCSIVMKKQLNQLGYGLECSDDNANYNERFKQLKNNSIDFAVGTIDSYILNGKSHNYPGPIVTVIDESKGGDALVAQKDKVKNIEALKQLNDINVAFTPDSPSHHLLKSVASHFDLDQLLNKSNHLYSNGSQEALQKLLDNQADIAVLWEPEVTKSLENENIIRLLGTEDTQSLIVDVLIASNKTVNEQPSMVNDLLVAYFQTLKFYRNNESQLIKDLRNHFRLSESAVKTLLKGVEWMTLTDNVERWYSFSGPAVNPTHPLTGGYIIEAIDSAINILLSNKDFSQNPLPASDSFTLINSEFVKHVHQNIGITDNSNVSQNNHQFSPLTTSQWKQLIEVGSLKIRNLSFTSGTSELTQESKDFIKQIMQDLKHYPKYRVEIRGHTGIRGDSEANQTLSQNRANRVMQYLNQSYQVQQTRMRALGFGSKKPLQKLPGESNRAYNYRLPRVEIALMKEVY